MIALTLDEIAAVVGGTVVGDHSVTVTAPAVLDSRNAEPGGLFVAFAGEQVDGHDFAERAAEAGAVAVLGSRATAVPTVVVDDVATALQTLAVHVVGVLRDRLTVVAVTGSQGKTSTKNLLLTVLAGTAPVVATIGNFNNELGVPITMLRADESTRFLVVEMGARRIGDIARLTGLVAPDIAVVLNVGKAHIGEFGSREAIALGKSELVQGLAPGGTAILNADDPRVAAMRSLTDGPVMSYGRSDDADVRVVGLVQDRLGRPSFTLQSAEEAAPVVLPLVGAHQAVNAAAAVAAGLAAGIPLEASAAALATTAVSEGRMEMLELAGGVTLLNDTYNASPDSTRAALDALASIEGTRRIALLGEILELGADSAAEHLAVGEYAATRAEVVVAVGAGASPIATGVGASALSLGDNETAIEWLNSNLVSGDVVLVKASHGARLYEVAAALVESRGGPQPTESA